MLSFINENRHPTEKLGTFLFIVGYFSLKKCALQCYQMTKKESLIMLHMNKSSHFLTRNSSILQLGQNMLKKYIFFIWPFILFFS